MPRLARRLAPYEGEALAPDTGGRERRSRFPQRASPPHTPARRKTPGPNVAGVVPPFRRLADFQSLREMGFELSRKAQREPWRNRPRWAPLSPQGMSLCNSEFVDRMLRSSSQRPAGRCEVGSSA